jgi:hypothetical protein
MTAELRPNRLFDDDRYRANANYEPGEWEQGADIVWHSSESPVMPQDKGYSSTSTGGGIHVGTRDAADERAFVGGAAPPRDKTVHPLQLTGQSALAPRNALRATDPQAYTPMGGDVRRKPGRPGHTAWGDEAANYSQEAKYEVDNGVNVPYVNEAEDKGSVSFRSPRQNLKTWNEAVSADPNAPTRHKAVAESGYDLSHPMNTRNTNGALRSMNSAPQHLPGMEPKVDATSDEYWGALEAGKQTQPRLRRPSAPPGKSKPSMTWKPS